ncbi:MAG: IclR family transcriptional regulator [Acidimicrobiales bacterium]
MSATSSVTNQTLDRGLSALTLIAGAAEPPTINEVADALHIHRSMAYRIVRTLEVHGMTRRDNGGRCHPGHVLASLGRGVERPLRELARPELERLANRLGMTAFVAVPSGGDVVTIDSAEPAGSDSMISYRPGTRHPLERGAPGLAILAGQPPVRGERSDVTRARQQGWAQSTGEVIAGLGSLATWITDGDGTTIGAVACLYPGEPPEDISSITDELHRSATLLGALL